jgi:hypothetical protein
MSGTAGHGEETFRTGEILFAGRIGLVFGCVIAVTAIPMATHGAWAPAAVAAGFSTAIIFTTQRFYLHTRVTANDDGVEVVNAFSVYSVGWAEIASFDAARLLNVKLKNGTVLRAWAIQTPKMTFGRESESQVVAARLNERLARLGGTPPL